MTHKIRPRALTRVVRNGRRVAKVSRGEYGVSRRDLGQQRRPTRPQACDAVVEIPVYGLKNSLNVANVVAVALFDVVRRWRK